MIAWLLNGGLVAVIYMLGLILSLAQGQRVWSIARVSALLSLLVSVLTPLVSLVYQPQTLSPIIALVTALVAFLGWVIISYSATYLQGDSRQPRFVRAMLFTIASVLVLVSSQHLLLMVLGWSASSVGLHYLLTHYQHRKAAQIVAHKKFIVSRLADVSLIVALALIYQAVGSLSLDALQTSLQNLSAGQTLPNSLHVAAVLFVIAGALKSAQLPLHGWLIQVMEAPTPVSAILHAGVVNMSGFVLISLAALLNQAPVAQALLVIMGSITAVLASWVMMTRISIKVRLAWSTCAQMGFMLIEIGLGLYELALLHLVAHSLYKAHAFLSAGDVVKYNRQQDLIGKEKAISGAVISVFASASLIWLMTLAWQFLFPSLRLPTAAVVVLTLGFAPLFWQGKHVSWSRLMVGAGLIAVLFHVYLLWHWLFAGIAPTANPVDGTLLSIVIVSFTLLYAGQVVIHLYAKQALVKRIFPWVYNGFYLDETFTRLTFKLWPAKLDLAGSKPSISTSTHSQYTDKPMRDM
ncbi:NADH-quinone oxidoreductase subunit L [Thalassotalea ponticola]|uniref:NADH-quinone oxidoreductase subunit L n=1 Tax=Thalassotalea ponticola TaxID=1523392 RepID=UPI0025B2C423|nr:NADH-quinone oxidoreductase subunit L [Thalassotalea ponticola]MDN3652370.1 NADH-quinone oxidoreductase subunit L [Thalassotalea ponticola]